MIGTKDARAIVEIKAGEDPLLVLGKCGGYYECPKDDRGNRLGPLVGYAGRYKDSHGEDKQFVGDVYANFAMAERYPHVLYEWACDLETRPAFKELVRNTDVFCAAPMGGLAFGAMLALVCRRKYVFLEKKITALATKTSREESTLVFGRHEVGPGDQVIIVEDVLNNFSTTAQIIALLEQWGAKVIAIVGILNRSIKIDDSFEGKPVVSLVRKSIQEYRQMDGAVIQDIITGNVIWKPKNDWPTLMEAMNAVQHARLRTNS